MAAKQGMNPGSARTAAGSMQAQVNALSDIASALSATWSAGNNPSAYGVVPGEPTIAPWSLSNVNAARVNLVNAQNAANGLLQRIESEASAQETASGNDPLTNASASLAAADATGASEQVPGLSAEDGAAAWDALVKANDVYSSFTEGYEHFSGARDMLELPLAASMAFSAGAGARWAAALNPQNWGRAQYITGETAVTTFSRSFPFRPFRGMQTLSANLRIENLVDPDFIHTTARHRASSVASWADRFHRIPRVVSNVQNAVGVAGKGFAVLGVASGAITLTDGILGASDGDVSGEDAWAIADGAVSVITGIGSFAPPPVGVVFAGVGAIYSGSRWLFGEDENGKTGLQRTGEFFEGAAGFIGDSATNINNFASDLYDNVNDAVNVGVQVAARRVADGAEAVGDFVEDLWPPW